MGRGLELARAPRRRLDGADHREHARLGHASSLEAARALPGVDPAQHVPRRPRGNGGGGALRGAPRRPRERVLLDSPPATQNAPSEPDGKGPAIEMLNCLRYTDLAQVAALLYPAHIAVAGSFPSTYEWAEKVYRSLTPPGRFDRVKAVADWTVGAESRQPGTTSVGIGVRTDEHRTAAWKLR